MKAIVRAALVVLAVLGSMRAAGDPPALPPGMGKYLVALWIPGTPHPLDPSMRIQAVPEPDVAKMGGQELKRNANFRVVLLPRKAVQELRRHEAVAYVQRIWVGEPMDTWNEELTVDEQLKATPETDSVLTWGPKAYVYDGSGNIKKIKDDQYSYDSAGRLIRELVNGQEETFKYDEFGNLTEKAIAGAPPVSIPVDGGSNRLIGPQYDAAGNMTMRGRIVYKYDSLNRMSAYDDPNGTDRRIIYDANDERIGAVTADGNSRWTIRDFQGQILREFRGDDQSGVWPWERDYIRGEGQLLAGETQTWQLNPPGSPAITWGGKRHYHLDHLGSVRVVTNQNGASLAEDDYFAFGTAQTRTYQEDMNPNDPHVDGMRFAGHWRDFLGYMSVENPDYIDYMHARYYDPGVGRFLSVDPAGSNPAQPQSFNRYSYASNNPVNRLDPDGKADVSATSDRYRAAAAFLDDFGGGVSQTVQALKQWRAPVTIIIPAEMLSDAIHVTAEGLRTGTGTGKAFGDDASTLEKLKAIGADYKRAAELGTLIYAAGSVVGEAFESVAASGQRFFKKAPKGSLNFRVENLEDGTTRFSYETPATNIPGSKAVYEKIVDGTGKALKLDKTTYDPEGNIVHIKPKL